MTRTEAIAMINAKLAISDDETVEAIAALIGDLNVGCQLSNREHGLLMASKADFADGRTLTTGQVRARTDALFSRHRTKAT